MSLYTAASLSSTAKQPVVAWSSAALKGLYQASSQDHNRSSPKSRVSGLKRSLEKRLTAHEDFQRQDWQLDTDGTKSRCARAAPFAEGREDSGVGRSPITVIRRSRDSLPESTKATIRPRRSSKSTSSMASSADVHERETVFLEKRGQAPSIKGKSQHKKELSSSQLPLSTTMVTAEDVAASMGMISQEGAEQAGSEDNCDQYGKPARLSARQPLLTLSSTSQSIHSSPRSPTARSPQSIGITHSPGSVTARNSRSVARPNSNNTSIERSPPIPSHIKHLPLHSKRKSTTAEQLPRAVSTSVKFSATQSGGPSAMSRRIPLTELRKMPRSNSARRSEERRKTKQEREKSKVEYYFDSERGVMIRRGLYDEEHRPKERSGRGIDLFRRLREARIWDKLATHVLW